MNFESFYLLYQFYIKFIWLLFIAFSIHSIIH